MMSFNPDCPKLPWMVEFYSNEDGTILNGQLAAVYASTNLEYLSALNIKSKTPAFRATQLVCTLPQRVTCQAMEELMDLGMSMARIAYPACEKEKIMEMVIKLRAIHESYSRKIGRVYPLAMAVDVKGPEIRVGQLENNKESVYLPKGKIVTLTTDDTYDEFVNNDMIYVDYTKLPDLVQPGDKIYVDYGNVRLSAIEAAESIIKCIVEKAGNLISHSSIIVPNTPLDLPTIGDDDKELIQLAIDNCIDYIIVSGIYNRENIFELRKIFGPTGDKLQLISKIENTLAIENVNEIIENSDGIFIDHERLLLDVPKEKAFLIQKSILAKCNLKGVPVICSTNILDSLSLSKSEVCDIAGAIIDGADALSIPPDACTPQIIKDVTLVCKEAEPSVYQRQVFEELVNTFNAPSESIYSLCISAVESSLKTNAAAIICLTTSGRSAKLLSRFKPRCPIIAITRYSRIARILKLFKSIEPLVYIKSFDGNWQKDVDERVQLGVTYGKYLGYIRMGDAVVTLTGSRPEAGLPNCMKIVYASDYDTIVKKTKFVKKSNGKK